MVVRMAPCTSQKESLVSNMGALTHAPEVNYLKSERETPAAMVYVANLSLYPPKSYIIAKKHDRTTPSPLSRSLSLAHEVLNITQALRFWFECAIVSE